MRPPGILTTDSGPKEVLIERPTFTVAGMAKGAGMLAPDMATMLAFLTTDASVEPGPLADLLRIAGARLVQLDDRGRLHLDQRHGRPHGIGTGRVRPTPMSSSTRSPRPAPPWPARCWPTPRVPRRSSRSGSPGPDRTARLTAPPARWPTRCWSSAPSTERTPTGAGWPASSDRPGWTSTWTASRSTTEGSPSAATAWRPIHDGDAVALHLAGGMIDIHCRLGLADGDGVVMGVDLGHGYIDENRTTS